LPIKHVMLLTRTLATACVIVGLLDLRDLWAAFSTRFGTNIHFAGTTSAVVRSMYFTNAISLPPSDYFWGQGDLVTTCGAGTSQCPVFGGVGISTFLILAATFNWVRCAYRCCLWDRHRGPRLSNADVFAAMGSCLMSPCQESVTATRF
jgi:hypothetical protein